MEATTRSYQAVPPEAVDALRPALPRLAEDIIAAIARDVPGYSRALEGVFGNVVRRGVEIALSRFLDLLADPEPDAREARGTYVELGRGEFRAGRPLDALLAAYRVGARLAWRGFVDAGQAAGLPPAVIYALGEAIFAYIDELSAESVEGYAEEQSAAAGESERRRRRLVRLLAAQPAAPAEALRTAATGAGWSLPRGGVAALVCGTGREGVPGEAELDSGAARLARRLGEGAVGAESFGAAIVFVPDPDAPGRARRLAAAVAEQTATLGPTVGWEHAGTSAARAAATHRLAVAGRLPGVAADGPAGLLRAEDHLGHLLLRADAALCADLAAARLAPLAGLADGPRARLTETLAAWLDRPGQVQAVAADLAVHPQTVRYRVRQLRDLFGERLEDPDARFELALALRAR